jgi:hypothetical protein
MSDDFERFKAAYVRPFEQAPDLPTPAKSGNGPRFAAVETPVQHVAGTLEAVAPKARAKTATSAKGRSTAPAEPLALLPEVVARFVASAIERNAIRKRKDAGEPPPWTTDPILASGHFCNVHREHDKVTRWIMAHVIAPNKDDPDLVFKIAVARFLNEPEALARLHWPAQFNLAQIHEVLQAHAAQGGKLFRTEAYKPPMPGKGEGTLPHLFEVVLPPIWREREELRPRDGDTLQAFCDRWRNCYKIGDFLAGQITADAKHVAPLFLAADWRTFAVPGPGSKRGLNRLCGRPLTTSWSEAQWHATLLHLRAETEAAFAAAGLDPCDAQNVQNWCCEFDKYERARDAGGMPSRRYRVAEAPPPTAKRRKTVASKPPKDAAPDPRTTAAEPETEQNEAETRPSGPGPHCLAAALGYAARGWKLFPAPRGAKKSHRKAHGGGERWGATRDPGEIAQDFARWPEANIGLPTDRDNGFWVLEADTLAGGHTHDGIAALQALIAQHGPLPETRTAVSPSGSQHYYFKHPAGRTIRNRTNCPVPGVDVKGEGGMVIAPPSLRGSGAYRWIREAEIAEAPAWLLDLVATASTPAKAGHGAAIPDDLLTLAERDAGCGVDVEPLPSLALIKAALDAIPIADMTYQRWIEVGHAVHAASGGSEKGLALYDAWTRQSSDYNADGLAAKWQSFHPHSIGAGSLFYWADEADPDWRDAIEDDAENAQPGANQHSDNADGRQQTSGQTGIGLISVRASDVDAEALSWLWMNRFALGKLGIIAGLPDEGKGLLTAFIAACCTNPGLAWPCGEGKAPQGNVILFTAEDDLADTVVPRLVAAGAKLNHVHIIRLVLDTDKHGKPRRRMFSLARDLEMLRAKIAEIGDVVLIIIDPISAYLGIGEIDSFRDTDVRAVLAPLQDLAGELHTAVIAIMHFNKKVDMLNMLLRVCNSIAFTAAARHAFGVVYDADNHRRLLVRGKNNLAKRDDRALAFRVDAYEVGHDKRSGKPIEAPFLIWEAEYVDITATEALQAVNENKAPGARGIAKRFLQSMLRNGPVAVTEIKKAAGAEGIAIKTLTRAKQELGIVAKRDGSDGEWQWYPPQDSKP